jgi:hypothetical protein
MIEPTIGRLLVLGPAAHAALILRLRLVGQRPRRAAGAVVALPPASARGER